MTHKLFYKTVLGKKPTGSLVIHGRHHHMGTKKYVHHALNENKAFTRRFTKHSDGGLKLRPIKLH